MIASGLKPKKRLGQNFLRSLDVVEKIVHSLQLDKGELVLEIGAGEGVLTKELFDNGAEVVAVEKDRDLVRFLESRFAGNPEIKIIEGDFLDLDLQTFVRNSEQLRIAGNIPYNITSPILFKILDSRSIVRDVLVMVQQEVGERLVSGPGSKKYGIPTVLFNQFADVDKLFSVGRNSFYPVPKVDSVVIKIEFLQEPRFALKNEGFFYKLVRKTFGNRRKMLRNTLTAFADKEKLSDLSIDVSRRPEELTTEEFTTLANELCT
ncbi:ribosomal RNA small subunit methyltransferase A [bacterium]|nr:ribosomal RNA small subunit methyltransferase A [bacterium]